MTNFIIGLNVGVAGFLFSLCILGNGPTISLICGAIGAGVYAGGMYSERNKESK